MNSEWRKWEIVAAVALGGVAVRVVNLTQPFIDAWGWRQADVAQIAESLYRRGYNPFFTTVRDSGPELTRVVTEFPLLPFLAALIYPVTGEQEWVGRGITVAFWALSVPFFFTIVKARVGVSGIKERLDMMLSGVIA